MSIQIAIDGPAGAGKSTIARQLAQDLGYIYVDTGAMYRAIALHLIRKGIDVTDNEGIDRECKGALVEIEYKDGTQVVLLNGENVNGLIRTEEVSKMASVSSARGVVRAQILQLQRDLGKTQNVVMDGRDIGTTVLPFATVKIYLTASSYVRAQRRFKELTERGEKCDLETIEKDIIERDNRDMNREISPLKQAEDAVLVDTSDLSIEEVKEAITKIVAEKTEQRD